MGRLLEDSFHCVQMNDVTGKTSYATKSHFPNTKETGRRLKMYIYIFFTQTASTVYFYTIDCDIASK